MIEIILIEIVAIVSFLYSIFFLFSSFTSTNEVAFLFLWTVAASTIYAVVHRRSRIFEVSILLLFLPLILYRSSQAVFFIIVTTLVIFLYIKNSLARGNHYAYVSKIKTTYLLYPPLIYLNYFFNYFKLSITYAAPFIIIYLLSSIILARTIRHLDTNMGLKDIRKNNVKNILIMSAVYAVTAFENLRDSLLVLGEKILIVIYYPIVWLGKLRAMILRKLYSLIKIPESVLEYQEKADGEFTKKQLEAIKKFEEESPLDLTMLKRILGLLAVIVIIYIVYKLIMRAGNRRYESVEYVEVREYIKESKEKKKKRFKKDKFPKELREQIRYYYRRFLDKLKQNDIEILKTDSSLEINQKAEGLFGEEINRIREIYINTRYSDSQVDENLVREMESLYKKL